MPIVLYISGELISFINLGLTQMKIPPQNAHIDLPINMRIIEFINVSNEPNMKMIKYKISILHHPYFISSPPIKDPIMLPIGKIIEIPELNKFK